MKVSTKIKEYALIVGLIICVVLISFSIWWFMTSGCRGENSCSAEDLPRNTYYRLNYSLDVTQPSTNIMQTFKDANPSFVKAKIYDNARFLMFDSLDLIDDYMKSVVFPKACTHVYGLAGSDIMASKSSLVVRMRERLPRSVCDALLPVSYIIPKDIPAMLLEVNPSDIWILKKNVQRQEGQLITDNVTVLEAAAQDQSFVVAQKMLRDPFLLNSRKINLRVYMLVVGDRFYYYTNGFMYYTSKHFRYSTNKDEVITTGYIDRRVYDENPLTLQDFKGWLGAERGEMLFRNIHQTIGLIQATFVEYIREANKPRVACPVDPTRFLIYGVDLAPDTKLNIKIMEINKGPDLGYKDHRDAAVKLNMVKDALALVGLGTSRSGVYEWIQV